MSGLERGYTCKCKRAQLFTLYVFAHWNDEITHQCKCGRKNKIKGGKVKIGNDPRKTKITSPHGGATTTRGREG